MQLQEGFHHIVHLKVDGICLNISNGPFCILKMKKRKIMKAIKHVIENQQKYKLQAVLAQKNSNPLFFLTASSAQTSQTEEFMFQNVAY